MGPVATGKGGGASGAGRPPPSGRRRAALTIRKQAGSKCGQLAQTSWKNPGNSRHTETAEEDLSEEVSKQTKVTLHLDDFEQLTMPLVTH